MHARQSKMAHHVQEVQPEIASEHIQYFQAIILAYLLAATVLFYYQVAQKKRISELETILKCERLKFILIWGPFLMLILTIEMITVVEAFMVNTFWYSWIDLL